MGKNIVDKAAKRAICDARCTRIILPTETPCMYNGQIVCSACDAILPSNKPSPAVAAKPSPVADDGTLRCARCKWVILPTETPCVYNNHVVCNTCDTVLRSPGGID